ncbi:beta-ketoacyl synthase N-terminal-like domain-containing protein [Denitromonas sp.]|uniref:ApeP family dehydratase n=1 Tax=Denitromonas sp. TaxID=2734609 RepID=UPI002B000083|nr:beta-ketoacyl synthase N-terminal-like domain-containing protein [Denitromonas sp.]
MRRVVVTGMAGITSLGDTWAAIDAAMAAGRSGVRRMPEWDAIADLQTRLGAPVVELMAQAIAAFVGLEAQRKGRPPKIGYLLGTRAYRCTRADFAPGSRIGIKADLVFRDDSGLGAFDCTLHHDGRQIAEATLKVYETPDHD